MSKIERLNSTLNQLLPQKPPFVFIDQIVELGEEHLKTAFNIKKDSLFLENTFFQSAGLVECMAQSAAIYVGVRSLNDEGDEQSQPPIGYIASISELNINQLPKLSDELNMTTSILNEIGSSLIVRCRTFVVSNLIAEARLQLFLT